MLTAEQNERLTRVGPGTPCGELMRRYWHPIAATSQLPRPGTRPIRVLGEDLVLYRDRSDRLGLVDQRCPHRKASLVFGMPDECGLRCTYHGWLYDAEGRCLEQPFETYSDPQSTFKDKIKIKAYPVEELGGLIFAYLGPEPRPLLPRWESFVIENAYREIGMSVIPCNWLQTVENAGDSSHVVSAHYQYANYVYEQLGRPELKRHSESSGAKGYFPLREHEENPYGYGAILFPYIDAQSDLTYQIRMPIDDTHTLHIWYMVFTAEAQAELGIDLAPQTDPRDIPFFDVPVPQLNDGVPDWATLDSNSGQDLVMWYSQGEIMDRTDEHLGLSDVNVIRMRQLLERQIKIVEEGGEPINTFRDPAENTCLVPPHTAPMPPIVGADGRPDLTNAVRKYSPAFIKAARDKLGEKALWDPVH